MTTCAIIPAAGSGKRFGGLKQFQSLQGKPLLLHTLEVFERTSRVDTFGVVVPEEEVAATESLIRRHGLAKISFVISGGKERQDSVARGFERTVPCDVILIHDGVRPLITEDVIVRAIDAALEIGGAVVGVPVKDTTKRVNAEGTIEETLDRMPLWSIQTPQAFRYAVFKKALERAREDRFLGTDEAMLVERLGIPIKVVLGRSDNIKVTTPEDLLVAEALLKAREIGEKS